MLKQKHLEYIQPNIKYIIKINFTCLSINTRKCKTKYVAKC